MKIEIARENDGRVIAEVPELPGVLVYGTTEAEARNKVVVLALQVIGLKPAKPYPFDQDGAGVGSSARG